MKIISVRRQPVSENETAAFSHTGFPRVSRTALTRRNASPREKCNSARGRWGAGAGTAVLDLPGTGSVGCRGAPAGLSLAQPSSCPRRHTPQTPLALQPPARALMYTGPPQPTPQSSPAVERPDRSGIGRSGVERSAEKRRGDVRPPLSQSHPKGESRRNNRLRGGRGGRRNAAGQAF